MENSAEAALDSARQKIQGTARLSRFFSKQIAEAVHLGGDNILFAFGQGSGKAAICKGSIEIKTIEVRADWYGRFHQWLHDRWIPKESKPRQPLDLARRFPSAVRVGDEIATFLVTLGSDSGVSDMSFSDIRMQSAGSVYATLGISEDLRFLVEGFLFAERGAVLAGAPDPADARETIACMLTLSRNGLALFDGSAEILGPLAQETRLLVETSATDALSAFRRFRDHTPSSVCPVNGVIIQKFLPKLCAFCCLPHRPSSEELARLPEAFRTPPLGGGFRSPAGCARCNGTGYDGIVGIQSILGGASEADSMIARGESDRAIAAHLAFKGLKSLLEDAWRKAGSGHVAFPDILSKVPPPPDFYPAQLQSKPELPSARPATAPASAEYAAAPQRPPAAQAKASPKTAAGKTLPVLLVVEDDADQRSILEMILRSAKYEVLVAGSGPEALRVMQRKLPDLVITDLMMPGMDGAELVTRIRAEEKFKNVPILILTVVGDVEREFQLLELGADDYCEKSIQRKIFLKRVENLVKRSRIAAG